METNICTIILFGLLNVAFALPNPPRPDQWLLVLNQDTTSGGYFASDIGKTGIQNKHNPQSNSFSIIGGLNQDDFLFNGAYGFKVIYGGMADRASFDKTWTQTSWLMDTTITGSSLGDYDEKNPEKFYGLSLSDHGPLLDGYASVRVFVCTSEHCSNDADTVECPMDDDNALSCPNTIRRMLGSGEFGFKTCYKDTSIYAESKEDFQIFYQKGTHQYSCDIIGATPGFDAVFTCKSDTPIGSCSEDDDFVQINMIAAKYKSTTSIDDVCIDAVIFDGEMIGVTPTIIGYNANECANGYYHQIGDIPGSGKIDGRGDGELVSDCNECADLCSDREKCLSYECSSTERHCNLNSRADPLVGAYKNYMFCTKEDVARSHPNEIYKRRYDIENGVASHSLPSEYGSLERVWPKCYTMRVSVTACEEWHDELAKKALKMTISGTNKKDNEYFYVNEEDTLPIMGQTKHYYFESNLFDGVGELYGIALAMADGMDIDDGYCISGVAVDTLSGYWTLDDECKYRVDSEDDSLTWTSRRCIQTMNFDADHFGNGILLKPDDHPCAQSFVHLNANKPLFPCTHEELELFAATPRGIYDVSIHTCDESGAGFATKNMQKQLYLTMQGKTATSEGEYESTDLIFLDHFVGGDLHLASLGDVARKIQKNWDELTFYPNTATQNMKMIGLKIEGESGHPLDAKYFADATITITGSNVERTTYVQIVGNGAYALLRYDGNAVTVSTSYQIKLSPVTYPRDLRVSIIVDAEDNIADYSLPFIVDNEASKVSWENAERYCRDTHGTSLLSIHSLDEMHLIWFFMSRLAQDHDAFWIGLNDQKKEGNWEWSDMSAFDYSFWYPGEPNQHAAKPENCVELWTFGRPSWSLLERWMNDQSCSYERLPLCNNPTWHKDTTRTFQINNEMRANEVVSVAIGNNDDDEICIDAVKVDGEDATFIANKEISSKSKDMLVAIFRYPVCASEVLDVRIDPGSEKIDGSTATTLGVKCTNRNPTAITCGGEQEVEASKTQSFSYEWGGKMSFASESSVTMSSSITKKTSDSFSVGLEFSHKVTGEGGIPGIGSVSQEIGFSANTQWTRNKEKSKTITQERSDSISRGTESWDSNQGINENGEVKRSSCRGSFTVPPDHELQTLLVTTTLNATMNTQTDIRLTKCDVYFSPIERPKTDNDYIYITVPGTIGQVETTNCEVSSEPMEYIGPQRTCWEHQQLAISSDLDYTPDCQPEPKEDLYEPCQCDDLSRLTSARCWCVNENGRKTGDLIAGANSTKLCQKLNCQPTSGEGERRRILASEEKETESNNLRIVAIGLLMAAVVCIMTILYRAIVAKAEKKIQLLDEDNSVQV